MWGVGCGLGGELHTCQAPTGASEGHRGVLLRPSPLMRAAPTCTLCRLCTLCHLVHTPCRHRACSHMAACTCCSSLACEGPNDITLTCTQAIGRLGPSAPRPHITHLFNVVSARSLLGMRHGVCSGPLPMSAPCAPTLLSDFADCMQRWQASCFLAAAPSPLLTLPRPLSTPAPSPPPCSHSHASCPRLPPPPLLTLTRPLSS